MTRLAYPSLVRGLYSENGCQLGSQLMRPQDLMINTALKFLFYLALTIDISHHHTRVVRILSLLAQSRLYLLKALTNADR